MSTAAAQITRHRLRRPRAGRTARGRAAVLQPRARAKRSGGPADRALYTCSCGYVFTAAVTSSVDCPHCGSEQAW